MTDFERYADCETIEDYKNKYPENRHVIRIVATDGKDVVTAYFDGNYDSVFVGNFITRYVYINNYRVLIDSLLVKDL